MRQTLSLKLNEQLDHEVLKGEVFTSIWSWECKGFKVNIKSLKHSQGVGVGFFFFFIGEIFMDIIRWLPITLKKFDLHVELLS
jgi:hypothetical protein